MRLTAATKVACTRAVPPTKLEGDTFTSVHEPELDEVEPELLEPLELLGTQHNTLAACDGQSPDFVDPPLHPIAQLPPAFAQAVSWYTPDEPELAEPLEPELVEPLVPELVEPLVPEVEPLEPEVEPLVPEVEPLEPEVEPLVPELEPLVELPDDVPVEALLLVVGLVVIPQVLGHFVAIIDLYAAFVQ